MAALIVHVVEDNAALYAAGSALLGVALGAGGSWLQQKSKIGADKERLKERLEAEEKRLDTQLEHDRDTREREALRGVLDDALEAARAEYVRIVSCFQSESFGQSEMLRDGAVGLAGSRLVLRLGRGHPVEVRFRELRDAINAAAAAISAPLTGDVVARRSTCKIEIVNLVRALAGFADAAADLVGSPFARTRNEDSVATGNVNASFYGPELATPDQAWD